MVDAIFRFVDNEKPVLAICDSQSGSKYAYSPIAKAFQRYRTLLPFYPDNRSAIGPQRHSSFFISDHRYAVHLVAVDNLQCLNSLRFIIRKSYAVPELRHNVIVHHTGTCGFALNGIWEFWFRNTASHTSCNPPGTVGSQQVSRKNPFFCTLKLDSEQRFVNIRANFVQWYSLL